MIATGESYESPGDKRSFVLQLLVQHFLSLIGCAVCITLATWVIATSIDYAQGKPLNFLLADWIVGAPIALLFWIGAINTQIHMIDRWREALQPLPPIDGSEIVLERKRANRFVPTVWRVGWLAFWTYVIAEKWPNPGMVLLGGLFIIPMLLRLKAMWLPKANDWAPLVIGAEGFEDRSGNDGKIIWSDVAAVNWNGSPVIKLIEPRQRAPGRKWRLEIRPRHMPGKKADEVDVHMHGLPSAHRAFRLMRAYWRLSRRTNPGNNSTITRAAR
jgi:hypothetical protein